GAQRRGAGRHARGQPADDVQAPQGAAGRRPGLVPDRRPAAHLSRRAGAVPGPRRVARPLPPHVEREPRRPRTPPRRPGGAAMSRESFQPSAPGGEEYHADGDRWTLVYVRALRHPPERVWDALTEPDQVAEWAPFTASRDLGRTGDATLTMIDGDDAQ